MIFPIVFEPNPILHERSADIDPAQIATPEMQKFVTDMIETMYVKDGVGLAAVQVGKSLQLCVIAKEYVPGASKDLCLINPTWTRSSLKKNWDEEGCLSVPGFYGQVQRYSHIKVRALDELGKSLEFEARDFFARIIQHETDHLNGTLFIEKAKNIRKNQREL